MSLTMQALTARGFVDVSLLVACGVTSSGVPEPNSSRASKSANNKDL
jgi:hypothetical protein